MTKLRDRRNKNCFVRFVFNADQLYSSAATQLSGRPPGHSVQFVLENWPLPADKRLPMGTLSQDNIRRKERAGRTAFHACWAEKAPGSGKPSMTTNLNWNHFWSAFLPLVIVLSPLKPQLIWEATNSTTKKWLTAKQLQRLPGSRALSFQGSETTQQIDSISQSGRVFSRWKKMKSRSDFSLVSFDWQASENEFFFSLFFLF